MKNVRFLISTVLLLTAVSACAQAGERFFAKASVPFPFTAENISRPAGTYIVSALPPYDIIKVQSADGRNVAMILTIPAQQRERSGQAKLVFHRAGGQYFLTQVWEQGSNLHRDLPNSKLARELAKKGNEIRSTTIVASAIKAPR